MGRPPKTNLLDDILEAGNNRVTKALSLYKEFLGETDIEKTKEEDFVIMSLVKGKTDREIRKELRERHPEYKFTKEDFEKFLVRNDDAVKFLENRRNTTALRHLRAKVQIEEHLASAAKFAERLAIECKNNGDYSTSVAALRTMADIVVRLGKIQGYDTSDNAKVANIVNIISEKHSKLKDRIHEADFKLVDVEESEE